MEFCETVSAKKATFKILLKTKNDPILLEPWIKHHLGIVGSGNCLIFDNMSDDAEVLAIYEKYRSEISVIQFSGFHNNVHDCKIFEPLYRALATSADFFVFIDTDEFLVLFEDENCRADQSLTEFLKRNGSCKVFPATWLNNTDWNSKRFVCGGASGDTLVNGFSWGKPILSTDEKLTGFINHNIQIEQRLFSDLFLSNFFLLHMNNLLPKQRVRANVNKLISRRFAGPEDSIETILGLDRSRITDDNIRQYLREIEALYNLSESTLKSPGELRAGCLELSDDGSIKYYGKEEREVVNSYLSRPEDIYLRAIERFALHIR
jgi:hypothetical protein